MFLLDKKLVQYISDIGPLRNQAVGLREQLKSTISNFNSKLQTDSFNKQKQQLQSQQGKATAAIARPTGRMASNSKIGIPFPAANPAEQSEEQAELVSVLKGAIDQVLSDSFSGNEIKELRDKFEQTIQHTLPDILKTSNHVRELLPQIINSQKDNILSKILENQKELGEKVESIISKLEEGMIPNSSLKETKSKEIVTFLAKRKNSSFGTDAAAAKRSKTSKVKKSKTK